MYDLQVTDLIEGSVVEVPLFGITCFYLANIIGKSHKLLLSGAKMVRQQDTGVFA